MTYKEMQKKYLSLIEELNPLSDDLTDDPDIAAKQIEVTNQIMFEMVRMKKVPKYLEMEVNEGQIVEFADIEKACGYEVYQINLVGGVRYVPKANGTVLKFKDSGTAEIDVYIYPERITEQNAKSYEFELPNDVLEIMPYGIAADLLKSDVSAEYGTIYANRYEQMLQRLDPRHSLTSVYFEGGVD